MRDVRSGETHAEVKFYNPEKGFGFATSAEGDLYIPAGVAHDYKNDLVSGARLVVVYQTAENGKGLAISKIISIRPPTPLEFYVGDVKFYNVEKGYGFIVAHMFDRDIFLHAEAVKAAGIKPEGGLRLEFSMRERDGKLSATAIRLPQKGESTQKKAKSKKRGATRGHALADISEEARAL